MDATTWAGPAPEGGSLTVSVPCRTSKGGVARQHPVTIHADWSVDTGHDLQSERIAAAFGGYLSCIDFVDVMVPVFRNTMQLWTRSVQPPIGRRGKRWTVEECRCSTHKTFADPGTAAPHARSPEHIARLRRVDAAQLRCLVEAASAAYGDLNRPPRHAAASLVAGPYGLTRVWGAGISPERVRQMHESVCPTGQPLPDLFYLQMAFTDAPVECLRRVLATTGDPTALMWALSTLKPIDPIDPGARAGWLALGTPRQDTVTLLSARYSPSDAARLGAVIDRHVGHAASVLAAWARIGCPATTDQLVDLHRARGDNWYAPSGPAVQRLHREANQAGVDITPTQAALVLATAGSVLDAAWLIRSGARDAKGAAQRLVKVGRL
ncbi:hypothetical protein [Nocardioides kribbensis]|uniref:DUF4192 family protein n=1 Tax=Nocardioides kribbensis TaxID=305517 RepID=A0ABV1NTE6_9ACTN